ncbi:MAG: ABC transporter substrate-binding protein, partial [Alphaproteobacteria bacterium]|nr:ABC transporter substrate-binding protein [Alphaproteobacteria bacterium]
MNKKILLAIVGIVAALSVATLIITRSTQYDDGRTEFRIGVIAPLTGENATVGQTCRQAVEFAVAKIYNPYIRYRVFIEDGRFQSARSASAAHRLISRNRVSAIITCDAPSAAAVAPIAETSGVFMISTISSAEENIVDNHHVFLNWTLPSAQTTLAHKMLQAANINRMVIFEL